MLLARIPPGTPVTVRTALFLCSPRAPPRAQPTAAPPTHSRADAAARWPPPFVIPAPLWESVWWVASAGASAIGSRLSAQALFTSSSSIACCSQPEISPLTPPHLPTHPPTRPFQAVLSNLQQCPFDKACRSGHCILNGGGKVCMAALGQTCTTQGTTAPFATDCYQPNTYCDISVTTKTCKVWRPGWECCGAAAGVPSWAAGRMRWGRHRRITRPQQRKTQICDAARTFPPFSPFPCAGTEEHPHLVHSQLSVPVAPLCGEPSQVHGAAWRGLHNVRRVLGRCRLYPAVLRCVRQPCPQVHGASEGVLQRESVRGSESALRVPQAGAEGPGPGVAAGPRVPCIAVFPVPRPFTHVMITTHLPGMPLCASCAGQEAQPGRLCGI